VNLKLGGEDMDIKIAELFIPAMVGIIGSVSTYFIARNNNKKDLVIENRQSLSEDERSFRAELRDEIKGYREEIESLRTEISQLRVINTELTIENRRLMVQIEELRIQLTRLIEKAEKEESHE
jgi:predicted nuclease with TOPRIM domain